MTGEELEKTLEEYKPVIMMHEPLSDIDELLKVTEQFKASRPTHGNDSLA
jgi:hypothetical protein